MENNRIIIFESLLNKVINELKTDDKKKKGGVIKIKLPKTHNTPIQKPNIKKDDLDMGLDTPKVDDNLSVNNKMSDMNNGMGGDMGNNPPNDNISDNQDVDDVTKEIQSLAGKLAQQIRDSGNIDDNLKKQVKGTVDSALGMKDKPKNESFNINKITNNIINELKESDLNYDIDSLIDELGKNKKREKTINIKNIYKNKFF